jgi:hypothetical protein
MITNQLMDEFPNLTVIDGSPSQVSLQNDEKQVQLRFGPDIANVNCMVGTGMADHFMEFIEPFTRVLFNSLEITSLTRVGHRMYFHCPFESKADAETYIHRLSKERSIGGALFDSTEDPRLSAKKLTSFALRFEDEKIGIRLEVSAGDDKVNVSGPHAATVRKHLPQGRDVAIADIDIHTLKLMPVSDLLVEEWIRSNSKMAKTRILPLLKKS